MTEMRGRGGEKIFTKSGFDINSSEGLPHTSDAHIALVSSHRYASSFQLHHVGRSARQTSVLPPEYPVSVVDRDPAWCASKVLS